MRAAPPVSVKLRCGRAERVAVLVLHLLAAASVLAWARGWLPDLGGAQGASLAVSPVAASPPSPSGGLWMWAVGLLLLMVAALLGWHTACRLLPSQPRTLAWTGRAWLLDERPLQALQPVLDAGVWLLLRAQADGRRLWLLVRLAGPGAMPSVHALRLALHWHARGSLSPPWP